MAGSLGYPRNRWDDGYSACDRGRADLLPFDGGA